MPHPLFENAPLADGLVSHGARLERYALQGKQAAGGTEAGVSE